MKKSKRIIALCGAIILLLMYTSTFVFAILDRSETMGFLKASIACTIILPVLLYGYILVYKLSRKEDDSTNNNSKN